MLRNWNRSCLAWFALLLLGMAMPVNGAPITAGSATQSYVNIQQIRLFPGTPFNPSQDPIEFEIQASGLLTATWGQQVGTSMSHTVPFVDFQGIFPGDIPYHVVAGTPDLPPTTGEIYNIVQNPLDPGFAAGAPSSMVTADYKNTAYFKQILPDGTTIYSDQVHPAIFTAKLGGLPYVEGQEFVSDGPLNLYLQLGPTANQSTDLLIGQSLHRVVQVVPEPATSLLISLSMLCGLRVVRRALRTEKRNLD